MSELYLLIWVGATYLALAILVIRRMGGDKSQKAAREDFQSLQPVRSQGPGHRRGAHKPSRLRDQDLF